MKTSTLWLHCALFGALITYLPAGVYCDAAVEEEEEAASAVEAVDEDDEFDPDLETPKIVDGFTEDEWKRVEQTKESHVFQAETSRLMDIIINSLYTNKEVFLRELISNAADAVEKARYMSVKDSDYLKDEPRLDIRIEFDENANTLSIVDTGCGMSKEHLINHLGTIAKSGTTNFLEAMTGSDSKSASDLIGQFGVGFYAAYLVAHKVVVTSKAPDDDTQNVWESAAGSGYTISPDPRGNTLGRGTRVTLHLKEDAHDFMNTKKLKELAIKYSQFVQFPILIQTEKEIDDPDTPEGEDAKKITVTEWDQVNTQKPIWTREKEEIGNEEYHEFYKSVSKDYMEPASWVHFKTDGEIEFRSVLFLPKRAPFDAHDNFWTKQSEIKLYVRRVLIADKFEDLLPKYLNFVKGVVDSDDLPLNVNREQLQQTKILSVISKKLVKKTLDMVKDFAKDSDREAQEEEESTDESEDSQSEEKKEPKKKENAYHKFYDEFGKNLKMGCYEDDLNRKAISKLMRFKTTKSDDKYVSLKDIVDRLGEGQDKIYYASGDEEMILLKSANMQAFLEKDIEVILLTDHLDEPCLQKITSFEDKKFTSIQGGNINFDDSEEAKNLHKRTRKYYKPLTDWWKSLLEKDITSRIQHVKVSQSLVDSPCMVVSGMYGHSAHQERVMKAQAFNDPMAMGAMAGKRSLEINPKHPLIINLLERIKNLPEKAEGDESVSDEEKAAIEVAQTLYEVATLEGGFLINDPTILSKKMFKLMGNELGVEADAPLQEVELPEEEEEVDEEAATSEDSVDVEEEEVDEEVEVNEEL